MATRIFSITSRVLMSAMSRKGLPHLAHLMSMAKVLRRSSAQGMYFVLRAGFCGCSVAVASVEAWGTTWLRSRACDESTPQ
jgi:hypothetical protein